MKKLILFGILFLLNLDIFCQNKAEDILGNYMVPDKDGALKIYESKGKYYGKLVWLLKSESLDDKNPDKTKHTNKVLGMNIMNDFIFDGKSTWKEGTIYDPKNGKTYDCKITRESNGDLNVRGFIGISLLGRTETFVRLKDQ
jgi:uncharacterized protein (DUF2147 family)